MDEPHGDEAHEMPDEGEGRGHEEIVPEQGIEPSSGVLRYRAEVGPLHACMKSVKI